MGKSNETIAADLSNSKQEVKQLETKYNEALGSVSEADLMKERDQLKEKNEKLTGMCKKYIAKIKQLDAQIKQADASSATNKEIEELKETIASLENEVRETQSGNAILQEEMMSKYQVIGDLQGQGDIAQEQLEEARSKFSVLQTEADKKQQENEDTIRNLKKKLDEAPENVSVGVDESKASSDHEKTKTELANLKEKCKKLIVKVKQQDALIRKAGRKESTSSEVSTVAED